MIKQEIQKSIASALGRAEKDVNIEKPKNNQADYAFGVFALAKESGKSLNDVAIVLARQISDENLSGIDKVEASGGYVNFFLTADYLQHELLEISKQEHFGRNDSLKGKTIMVEYTDPNPFKLFHIGHLMSNTIGEAIARLYNASGAKVLRVNYQGDVGMHVAKAIWAMQNGSAFGEAYTVGSKAFEEDEKAKEDITAINDAIYKKSDKDINKLYDAGRAVSLAYFEKEYKRLGTKFDHYFFESEVAEDGVKLVEKHPDVFKESQGAVVFEGEPYGLHTRVFINSKGLPTYEAKELALNKKKFDEFQPDLSVIVTANEVNEYFKVLLQVMKVMVQTLPGVAEKTKHIGHGMMRLPSGKMSSRTGQVITADAFIEQTKTALKERESGEIDDTTREAIAVGAIKYSILKQSPGRDIIFDFDKSLAVKGDSGPYLQYTYARLKAILAKAGESADIKPDTAELVQESELALIKHFLEFPEAIRESCELIAPQRLALYVFELANLANSFYEKVYILNDEDTARMSARLLLTRIASEILAHGLSALGIKTPERI
jgi:arginyl-tRNA synthetase